MIQSAPLSVYADFNNADPRGRVRLNTLGTSRDMARQQIELRPGLTLTLYSDDADDDGRPDELMVSAVVEYSPEEGCWVAVIDWSAVRHASAAGGGETVAADPGPLPPVGRPVIS